MKNILILILYTDDPTYRQYKQVLESTYLSNLPDNVKYLFYKGGIKDEINLQEKMIYLNCSDTYGDTTIKTYKAFKSICNINFDLLLRVSCSSYFDIDKLNKFVENVPTEKYCGAFIGNHNGILFPSGCGYLLSKDIVDIITKCDYTKKLFESNDFYAADDVALGLSLIHHKIHINPINRYTFTLNYQPPTTQEIQDAINSNVHHYRCKKDDPRHQTIETANKNTLTTIQLLHKTLKGHNI